MKYDRSRAKLTYSEFCAHAPQTRHLEWERRPQPDEQGPSPAPRIRLHRRSRFPADADSDGHPDWIMFFQPGPKARAEYRAFTKRGGPTRAGGRAAGRCPCSPPASKWNSELIQRGVTGPIARELVQDHTEEKIRSQIERLDWLVQKKPDKIGDPAAYLVRSHPRMITPPQGVCLAGRAAAAGRSQAGQGTQGRRGASPAAAGGGPRAEPA